MTNRTKFIILYGAIFVFFAVPYVIHLVNLATVAFQINLFENSEMDRFTELKTSLEKQFLEKYPEQKFHFLNHYSIDSATTTRDTVVSFFIYSNTLNIKSIDFSYANCLSEKAESEAIKAEANRQYNELLNKLEQKHGSLAKEWAIKLGKDRFVHRTYRKGCERYYDNTNYYETNKRAFAEFDRFLSEYKYAEQKVIKDERVIDDKYETVIELIKQDLSEQEIKIFDEQLAQNPALKDGNQRFTFNGQDLGQFEYTIPSRVIDSETIQDALDIVYNEKYKENSLSHGAMPYAYCYGKLNTGSSGVKVNAGNQDVLVMVKNRADKVIRHVYVRANRSFTLRVPNGHYSVHFYYGSGWNPKKEMKAAYCGPIVGGFIYYESLTKDPDELSLYNDIMEYTLYKVEGGNFSTVPSSVSEAF